MHNNMSLHKKGDCAFELEPTHQTIGQFATNIPTIYSNFILPYTSNGEATDRVHLMLYTLMNT